MAINPSLGFPFDPFPYFPTLIHNTIPGIRFTSMARLIRLEQPQLLGAITRYSRDEYQSVSKRISALMVNPSPMQIAAKCGGWAEGPMRPLMEEHRSYNYLPENHVVRVLLSHFLAFSRDKLASPEFFCWPGAWMAGENIPEEAVDLFERHGALFVDRETDTGIYPRLRKEYDEKSVQKMFDNFYAGTVLYETTDKLSSGLAPLSTNTIGSSPQLVVKNLSSSQIGNSNQYMELLRTRSRWLEQIYDGMSGGIGITPLGYSGLGFSGVGSLGLGVVAGAVGLGWLMV